MAKAVQTNEAPGAIGPYSQAVISGGMVFSSGQIALDPHSGQTVDGGIVEQTQRVCQNLQAVLAAAGSSLDAVVKTTCFLSDMADFDAFNEVYARYFTSRPARSCVAVKQLPKNVLVEIEVIAQLAK